MQIRTNDVQTHKIPRNVTEKFEEWRKDIETYWKFHEREYENLYLFVCLVILACTYIRKKCEIKKRRNLKSWV